MIHFWKLSESQNFLATVEGCVLHHLNEPKIYKYYYLFYIIIYCIKIRYYITPRKNVCACVGHKKDGEEFKCQIVIIIGFIIHL
jgi:hypothetical protein